jgi:hypothetical protein
MMKVTRYSYNVGGCEVARWQAKCCWTHNLLRLKVAGQGWEYLAMPAHSDINRPRIGEDEQYLYRTGRTITLKTSN